MSVRLTADMRAGSSFHGLFSDFDTAVAWMTRHRGEYTRIEAREISAGDIRQGKE